MSVGLQTVTASYAVYHEKFVALSGGLDSELGFNLVFTKKVSSP